MTSERVFGYASCARIIRNRARSICARFICNRARIIATAPASPSLSQNFFLTLALSGALAKLPHPPIARRKSLRHSLRSVSFTAFLFDRLIRSPLKCVNRVLRALDKPYFSLRLVQRSVVIRIPVCSPPNDRLRFEYRRLSFVHFRGKGKVAMRILHLFRKVIINLSFNIIII